MALPELLRRFKIDAIALGFGSSFRDWCNEETNFPSEVAEMALAHTIKSKVEAACRRGKLFGKTLSVDGRIVRVCAIQLR